MCLDVLETWNKHKTYSSTLTNFSSDNPNVLVNLDNDSTAIHVVLTETRIDVSNHAVHYLPVF